MLNGLLWSPSMRKKRSGARQANAKTIALAALTPQLQSWASPSWDARAPRRVRLRLRASALFFYKRPPLLNALLNALLPPDNVGPGPKPLKHLAPLVRGGAPLSAPIYLRVDKDRRPARAALRLFYLYLSNPTPAVVTSTKNLSL
jgi:hypothetical protein